MDARNRRMLWRCRRGMLELDIVLERFVARHYATLSAEAVQCLEKFLDLPDNDLWELIVGKQSSEQPGAQALLSALRNGVAEATP